MLSVALGACAAMLLACATLTLVAQGPPGQGLTAGPALGRVYDAIFDADFGEVPALTATACPPAPSEACQVLLAVAAWWQIQLDPYNTTRDALFQSTVETAIDATTSWTLREPEQAEAWFYLGGAYGARAQWRVLRGARLAAARDGKRIKNALERPRAGSGRDAGSAEHQPART
jgi:hypothetical protein